TFFSRGVSREQMTLRIEDADALRRDARYLDAVAPEQQGRGQLKLGNVNANARLVGTTAEYREIFNYRLAEGRFFTDAEDEARRRVVVVGADIPERLETSAAQLVGRTIAINGQPFEVIGVLDGIGGGFGNQNPDFAAFVPLRTAERRVLGREQVDNISVRVA